MYRPIGRLGRVASTSERVIHQELSSHHIELEGGNVTIHDCIPQASHWVCTVAIHATNAIVKSAAPTALRKSPAGTPVGKARSSRPRCPTYTSSTLATRAPNRALRESTTGSRPRARGGRRGRPRRTCLRAGCWRRPCRPLRPRVVAACCRRSECRAMSMSIQVVRTTGGSFQASSP